MNELEEGTIPWSYGEGDALKEIADWVAGRSGWQQQALRWLLDAETLWDEQLDELLKLALEQKAAEEPVKAGDLRMAEAAKKTVSLKCVDQVQHVNALAPDQRLSFRRQGLTVVYGRNGAGKSGYARILKHACRARRRSRDAILPSIDASSPGTPMARIVCCVNDQNRSIEWSQGAETGRILSAISVFDASTAPVHVDDANEVAYTPYPLQLLERLAEACVALSARANARQGEIESQTPVALRQLPIGAISSVGKTLASLSEHSDVGAVRALAGLSDSQQASLESLRRDLAGDPYRTAQQLRSMCSELAQWKSQIEKLSALLTADAVDLLYKAQDDLQAARQAADLAAAQSFAEEPLPHVGSEAWRQLWETARRYTVEEAYPGRSFPAVDKGDRCVLCHQTLDEQAADRLRRFEAYVQDETEKRAQRAAADCEQLMVTLAAALPTRGSVVRLRSLLISQIGDEQAWKVIRGTVVQLGWNGRRVLREHGRGSRVLTEAEVPAALVKLDHLISDLEGRAAALTGEAGSDERRRLQSEVKELEDRLWLGSVIDDVVAEVERKKQLREIGRVIAECSTNAITAKATGLANKLITDALRARFQAEVNELGVSYAGVELKREQSRTGAPRFRVRFIRRSDVAAGQVLSEGEHRAVALAAFLAELATAGGRSAIIFDDPVSSLDNEHRKEVARRIVREGKERQVIVFTHDIAFLLLIDRISVKEQAEKPLYRSIARGPAGIGLCSLEVPFHARTVPHVLDAIEKDLENKRIHYDQGREHDWRIVVRSFQDQLRECWERAVEDFVSPVFRHLSDEVDTRG